jgi:hypothetical protein
MTLERGKRMKKGMVGGAVAHFMGKKWLWSHPFVRK